jgi:4-hydroxy-tetrahydrodipicolinate reductase
MNQLLAVAILGASGRMGRALVESTLRTPSLRLAAAIERPGSPVLGTDAGTMIGQAAIGVPVTDSLPAALRQSGVLVDFTGPAATMGALGACVGSNRPIVIGTTGFTPEQKIEIGRASQRIPVCIAANYSVGVNVALKLVELAARTLGDDYDVEIVEAHHRHKVDSPSGTALAFGEAAASGLGRDLASNAIYGREGQIGARKRETIGFATVRGGDVVGDHTVMFLGDGERVEISHRASSRTNFASGALRAAEWLSRQPPGLYTMRDVLGLSD